MFKVTRCTCFFRWSGSFFGRCTEEIKMSVALLSFWAVWFGLSAHMKEYRAGLQACIEPVLMFNACLRAEYAYYRLVQATVAFQKVWCTDGAVYTALLNVSCITITDRGGWCGWHDVGCSNVWRAGLLEFLRGFADPLLMFKAAVVCVQLSRMCGNREVSPVESVRLWVKGKHMSANEHIQARR